MKEFTLEDIYGMTRKQYYCVTGITPDEMIRFLDAECMVLSDRNNTLREKYRTLSFASDEGRRIARLMKYIEGKLTQKTAKMKDIAKNDLQLLVN